MPRLIPVPDKLKPPSGVWPPTSPPRTIAPDDVRVKAELPSIVLLKVIVLAVTPVVPVMSAGELTRNVPIGTILPTLEFKVTVPVPAFRVRFWTFGADPLIVPPKKIAPFAPEVFTTELPVRVVGTPDARLKEFAVILSAIERALALGMLKAPNPDTVPPKITLPKPAERVKAGLPEPVIVPLRLILPLLVLIIEAPEILAEPFTLTNPPAVVIFPAIVVDPVY